MVGTGRFREDLFYRLNAAMFHIPPLRERPEDIPSLATEFLKEIVPSSQKCFADEVLDLFDRYTWPGNIRELKNVVNFAATMSTNSLIGVPDLPPYLVGRQKSDLYSSQEKALNKDLIQATLLETRFNKSRTAELLKISRRTLYNKMEKYGLK